MKVWYCSAVRDLAPPGELTSPQTHPFEFANAEMQYDSYRGLQVRLRCVPALSCPITIYHLAMLQAMHCCRAFQDLLSSAPSVSCAAIGTHFCLNTNASLHQRGLSKS